MLNLTISELSWIAKRRNIDGYKNMSKQQLENLVAETQRSEKPMPLPRSLIPSPRPLVSLPRHKNLNLFKMKIEDNTVKNVKNLFRHK